MAVVKKSRPKISSSPVASSQLPPTTVNWDRIKPDKGWVCVGIDLSLSGVALAGSSLDKITGEIKGPEFFSYRWGKGTHYFDRISDCVGSNIFIEEIQTRLGVIIELDDVYIAIEEPWPMGMVRKLQSVTLKQSAELQGAFIGGLLKYGYRNVFQINNMAWKGIIAEELEISNSPIGFNYEENPYQYAPSGKGSGKWRAKEYGLKLGLPDWPDIISSHKQGKIPRPESSKAKAQQPDDRYDSYAMLKWMEAERLRGEG